MNTSTGPRRTLAEILQEKITEKRTEVETMYSDVDSLQQRDLDPRVVEMYQSVGKILSKYRSGKVPKAFKVIAQFKNMLYIFKLTMAITAEYLAIEHRLCRRRSSIICVST